MISIEKLETELKKLFNYFKAGDYNYVIKNSKKLLLKYPYSSVLQNLLGNSYQQIGDLENAKKSFKSAIKLDSNNIAAMNNLANIYKFEKEYDKSKKTYERALDKKKNYLNALLNYGVLEIEFNKHNNGIKLFNKCIEMNKKNPYVYYNLGIGQSQIGNFKDAKLNFDKVLKIDPFLTEADQKISLLTKYDSLNKHYLDMKEKVMSKNLKNNKKVMLYYAYGKALEDIGNIEESIKYIREANKIKSNLINYHFAKDAKLVENIIKSFEKINLKNIKEKKSNKKFIFIVGMPRSGTSLIEQILSSHSNVYGAGELPFLKIEINKKFNFYKNSNINILDEFNKLDEISSQYQYFANFYDSKTEYFIDKLPSNFLWVGFIKLLFPDAKIIYTKRNLEDVCISCYKNNFEPGLNWTNEISDIVKMYKEHSKIMDFWKNKTENFIYTVEYEQLVNNFEMDLKKILEFCNLPFEENCKNFHQSNSIVKTLSVGQVRNPIYQSSINKYKFYKEELEIIKTLA
tara:strand:+ start:2373 stop:3917 length:1545 start_codon:yes stop_codon:yes gene_type:complete